MTRPFSAIAIDRLFFFETCKKRGVHSRYDRENLDHHLWTKRFCGNYFFIRQIILLGYVICDAMFIFSRNDGETLTLDTIASPRNLLNVDDHLWTKRFCEHYFFIREIILFPCVICDAMLIFSRNDG